MFQKPLGSEGRLMLCLPRHLRRLGLLIFLVTVLGCSDTSREVAPERKTARVVERGDKRTWLPVRPSKPVDPQPRIVATIKARGGKAMVDEAGIVAIDWQRAPIHNLDL